jgi:aminopeptidase N
MLSIVGVGAFIFHNTNRLNAYRTGSQRRSLSAKYERQYKEQASKPQPRVQGIKVDVDIFPMERRIHVRGEYDLINKTDDPIKSVFVNLPTDEINVLGLKLGEEDSATRDEAQGVYLFELGEPLASGQTTTLEFDLDFAPKGFRNDRGDTQRVYNGTFFNHGNLPQIGYLAGRELSDDSVRRKRKLAPKERMASIDDLQARGNNYISNHADWIDFEATVSTSPDQIAVAPGSLQREWSENGRRYFHYKADGKIICFFSFLSARYEVLRDSWNGVDIEIYHHATHQYNLKSMVKAMKASLEYCSENFSPYQHKQARILEFPRYNAFAQSFPNTIPYSESVGFIADVDPDDEKDVDYPVYVTAHEIAHQWWAHQVIGGNVQGATVLSETLAQYSALMVMKQMFGPEKMKRFLRHELDQYLKGRSGERKKELPLALVENQGYIHYNKGSLVMYALQDYIGEETVNEALAKFVQETGFQEPPYTTSRELIEHFREVTPRDLAYLIDDLFETITLYDNRAVAASFRKTKGGKFKVTLDVTSKKLRADEQGAETETPLNDKIDIGVLDSKGEYLFLEKRLVESEKSQFVVTVDKHPAKAGIDPLNKLIDRAPDNNITDVKQVESSKGNK